MPSMEVLDKLEFMGQIDGTHDWWKSQIRIHKTF